MNNNKKSMPPDSLKHMEDFTQQNYRRLLKLAKEQYDFHSYCSFDRNGSFVLWRHDVDYSPHVARQLAIIEAEEQIQSTYTFLLHSEFYNLMEREVTACVRDILSLGHHLGLHFDSHYYDIEHEDQLETHLLWEKSILENVFQQDVAIFSFHNTSPFTMSCRAEHYGGMVNVYSDYFQQEVHYCSDSNGYWRFERLEDVLKTGSHPRLQVLTHPVWWQSTVIAPRQRIHRCIDGRATKAKKTYDQLLKKFHRENIIET